MIVYKLVRRTVIDRLVSLYVNDDNQTTYALNKIVYAKRYRMGLFVYLSLEEATNSLNNTFGTVVLECETDDVPKKITNRRFLDDLGFIHPFKYVNLSRCALPNTYTVRSLTPIKILNKYVYTKEEVVGHNYL